MDPVSAAGLAIGVASIGLQVYTGCIQGIQLLITAANYTDDCKYLNLRLRMEQQRLFAWSETSGLLDLDAENTKKILESNTFIMHRTTVLDLLVQVQWLFQEFEQHHRRHGHLRPVAPGEEDEGVTVEANPSVPPAPRGTDILDQPERDAAAANFPLPERRRNFIRRAMLALKEKSGASYTRLRWVSIDKVAFETLLTKFSALNDNMTDILDARLQVEIHHTVQDTNRGVLQLHHRIADLGRLVVALTLKLDSTGLLNAPAQLSEMSKAQRAANADELVNLSQLAKFKAFNEAVESGRRPPLDAKTAEKLELGAPSTERNLRLRRDAVVLDKEDEDDVDKSRCEAVLQRGDGSTQRVWVEWKDYFEWDEQAGDMLSAGPSKAAILRRVHKLAALLNHSPKPAAFRTLHCLGFFDKAADNQRPSLSSTNTDAADMQEPSSPNHDKRNQRLGLVFERPLSSDLDTTLPPMSLHELLLDKPRPRLTQRIQLARAVADCLHYLHAVNWLHKGLRSHNVVFFYRTAAAAGAKGNPAPPSIDYARPYLSGFDFSRPARDSEYTEMGADDAEERLYRHPAAQSPDPDARERFKKDFDVYALGVLFVELAHWKPVWEVVGMDLREVRHRPTRALRVRKMLLEEARMAELGGLMGEVFEGAVRRCLEGPGEGDSSPVGPEGGKDGGGGKDWFFEGVVKPLGGIAV